MPYTAYPVTAGANSQWITNTDALTAQWMTTATTATYSYWWTSGTAATTVGTAPWYGGTPLYHAAVATPGPEEQARIERRRIKAAIERRRAVKKGRKLLLSLLTFEQMQEYAQYGAFTVIGSKGGIFRLRKEGRVQELDLHRRVIALHCIHTSYGFIREDNLIAMKLAVEEDEMRFRDIANRQNMQNPQPLELAA